jgi:SRSO17 transposase
MLLDLLRGQPFQAAVVPFDQVDVKLRAAQVEVSLHLAPDVASCPVNWRLFVPERWDPDSPKAAGDVAARRIKAGIPDEIGHREKWRLGLDMVDELIGWGLRPPLLVADAGYGEAGEVRQSLEERDIPYVVQVASTVTAYPHTSVSSPCNGSTQSPAPA